MGAHTAAAYAKLHPNGLPDWSLICPASTGEPLPAEAIARWDALADGLERAGVDGFLAAYDDGSVAPAWHDTMVRITRDRLGLHRHPDAVARALREVPRSLPFRGLESLQALDVPALVIGSHDEADPGHPYEIAAEWARKLPKARFLGGAGGVAARVAGGRLSRAIAEFAKRARGSRRAPGGRRAGGPGAGRTRSRRSRRPCCRPGRRPVAISRTTSSVMSVATPDARLGQAIHRPPAGSSARFSAGKRRSRPARRKWNATITSSRPVARALISTPQAGRPASPRSPPGAPGKASL